MKKIISLFLLLSTVVCNAQLSGLGNVPLSPPQGGGSSSLPFSSITVSAQGLTIVMTPDDLIQPLREKSIPGFLNLQGKLFGITNYVLVTPTTPYATFTNVLWSSPPNTCVMLQDGLYNLGTNYVTTTTNIVIIGQSISNTIIYVGGPNPLNTSGTLRLFDGCTIANLSFTCTNYTGYASPLSIAGGAPDGTATNTVSVINVKAYGDSDTIRGGGNADFYNLYNLGTNYVTTTTNIVIIGQSISNTVIYVVYPVDKEFDV